MLLKLQLLPQHLLLAKSMAITITAEAVKPLLLKPPPHQLKLPLPKPHQLKPHQPKLLLPKPHQLLSNQACWSLTSHLKTLRGCSRRFWGSLFCCAGGDFRQLKYASGSGRTFRSEPGYGRDGSRSMKTCPQLS